MKKIVRKDTGRRKGGRRKKQFPIKHERRKKVERRSDKDRRNE